MEDSVDYIVGLAFFTGLAFCGLVIWLIKSWNSNDSVLVAKEEIKAMDKMDEHGRWHS